MRKKIAIDIDDVLAANAEGFVQYSNERWGTSLTVEDYNEHWGDIWQTEDRETERRALEFLGSGRMGQNRAFADAKPVLRRLGTDYELVLLTSRRLMLQEETESWVEREFAGIFRAVHFAGIWDQPAHDRHLATKAEFCRQIGADFLVDDQIKHCAAAARAGVPAVLFGDYAWNRSAELPPGVVRCKSWSEVGEYFYERAY